jgi:hypothetical protein
MTPARARKLDGEAFAGAAGAAGGPAIREALPADLSGPAATCCPRLCLTPAGDQGSGPMKANRLPF